VIILKVESDIRIEVDGGDGKGTIGCSLDRSRRIDCLSDIDVTALGGAGGSLDIIPSGFTCHA